jgi:hypothetical protein
MMLFHFDSRIIAQKYQSVTKSTPRCEADDLARTINTEADDETTESRCEMLIERRQNKSMDQDFLDFD